MVISNYKMNEKYICEVCGCKMGKMNVEQHNNGKKHKVNLEYFTATGECKNPKKLEKVKNNLVKQEQNKTYNIQKYLLLMNNATKNQFDELDMIFPLFVTSLLTHNIYSLSVESFSEIVNILHEILISENENIEVSMEAIDFFKNKLCNIYSLQLSKDPKYSKLLKELNGHYFMTIFLKYLKRESFDIIEEITKYYEYLNMEVLLDGEDNTMLLQSKIIENYEKDVERYLSIYKEAKDDFNKDVLNC
jgi:hypothetical protein